MLKPLFSILFSLGILIQPLHAEEITLRLGSSFYPPVTTDAKDGLLDLVYQELANRLKMTITINPLEAAERVLINANEGIDDGDVGRVAGMESKYTNLIRVPIPVYNIKIVVYSKTVNFKVDGPESIKPYEIAIVKGKKQMENLTKDAPLVIAVETAEQAFTMLDKGRVDIVVFEKLQGLKLLRKMELKGIKLLAPPLESINAYLYLNKRHSNLIPKITAELKEMQQDGTLDRINDKVLKRYALQ